MSWAENTKFRLRAFALVGTVLFPGFLIARVAETRQQMASNRWPSVQGEVVDVVAKDWWSESDQVTKYYGRVVYRYEVDGREFSTDLTDLGPGIKRIDQRTALADVSRYRPGMAVQVYYNPDDPGIAILERGIPKSHLIFLVLLSVATLVCATASFFIVSAWLRNRKQT